MAPTRRIPPITLILGSTAILLALTSNACSQGLRGDVNEELLPGEILLPQPDSVLSGVSLVIADPPDPPEKRRMRRIVDSVRFEYSADGETWHLIQQTTAPPHGAQGELLDYWDAQWDTGPIASGHYLLRAVFQGSHRTIATTETVPVLVNKAPTAQAIAASLDHQPGLVLFDGSRSLDPDGTIVSWQWSFGDGGAASGPIVQHFYSDQTQSYDLSLTVEDDLGAATTASYLLAFQQDRPTVAENRSCICKSIDVRTAADGAALGPDGEPGGKEWPGVGGWHDGKSLGPLSTNPKNTTKIIGYLWEVIAEVQGEPRLCSQTQVSRGTTVWANMSRAECERRGGTYKGPPPFPTCTEGSPWAGTSADLDADGKPDFDVSSPAECRKKGGTWKDGKCHLSFPQTPQDPRPSPGGYKPHSPGGPSYYDKEKDGVKVHIGNTFLWLVTQAHLEGGNVGTTAKADIIAMVRGTDDKYCYVTVHLDLERKGSPPHKEDFTKDPPVTGASSVPGVP